MMSMYLPFHMMYGSQIYFKGLQSDRLKFRALVSDPRWIPKYDHKQSLSSKNRNPPELGNLFSDNGKQKLEKG